MEQELVAGVTLRGRKVLLVHNMKHGQLRIEPPGGKVHEGESYTESLEREVLEELGVEAGNFRVLGTYRTHSPEGDFDVHIYLFDILKGEPRVMEPEKIPSFGWYTFEELERLRAESTLVDNMKEAMEDLKKYLEP